MAEYVDPSKDPDLAGEGALPGGQQAPAGKKAPAEPQKSIDPSKTLEVVADTGDALDKLRKEAEGDDSSNQDPPKPSGDDKGGSPEAGKPKEEDGDSDPDAGKRKSAIPDLDPETPPADDKSGKVGLEQFEVPEGFSKPAAENWNKLKAAAKEAVASVEARLKAAEEERDTLKEERKGLETKAAKALTEEQEAEIAELRKWRNAVEITEAPELKSLDSKLAANTDSLLEKLREAGLPDVEVNKIRQIGVEQVDWDKLRESFSPQLTRFVDAKVSNHITLSEDRAALYKKLKDGSDAYMKQRQEQQTAAQQAEAKALEDAITAYSTNDAFSFLREQKAADDATAEQKAQIEEANKFAGEMNELIKGARESLTTPQTQAELLFGTVMAHAFKRREAIAKARVTTLEKELKELTDKIAAIKKSSGAGQSHRQSHVRAPERKPGDEIFDEHGNVKSAGEALDELKAQLESQQ